MKHTAFSGLLMFLVTVTSAFAIDLGINTTIYIENGEHKSGQCMTVNGSIIIGNDCRVTGTCRSVNGKIKVGSDSKVKELQTVNGGIVIEKNARVRQSIQTVNGPVTLREGVFVGENLNTINGPVELIGATLGDDLTTYNADITLRMASVIKGDILIKDRSGHNNQRKHLTIHLEDGSIIEGDVIVEDENMDVSVILGKGCDIGGSAYNVQVIRR